MQSNPYQAPKAALGGVDATEDTEKVKSGQKLLIYAILLNFVTMALQAAGVPLLGLLVVVAALGMSLVGIFRVASGMGSGIALKILLVILMFVPLVNLITLLILNSRATKLLREAGYGAVRVSPRMVYVDASKPKLVDSFMAKEADARSGATGRFAILTPREIEIARLIGMGASNKRIARHLAITERTVKGHLTAIFRKTGAVDRLTLALLIARRH